MNKKCKKLLDDAWKKYENPNQIDKLSAVNQKVGEVKNVMHDNIERMLEQGIKVEKMQLDSGKTFLYLLFHKNTISVLYQVDTKMIYIVNICC